MKHIKKTWYLQVDSESFNKDFFVDNEMVNMGDFKQESLKQIKKGVVFVQTDKSETIGTLIQKIDGVHCLFPVPDPTLVYFHNAQANLIEAKKAKSDLLKKLTLENIKKEIPIHDLYNYYGFSTSVIINLFTSLESFINQQIPTNYSFKKKGNKCLEIYEYKEVLEFIDFRTKLTIILPEVTHKDFMKRISPASEFIWNLKEFRDDIIHTKPKNEHPLYDDLIKKSLNFKFDKAIDSVAKFMNHYQEGYIVECDCGGDF